MKPKKTKRTPKSMSIFGSMFSVLAQNQLAFRILDTELVIKNIMDFVSKGQCCFNTEMQLESVD